MTDISPNAVPTVRLLTWVSFGRTSSSDARRGVSANQIDDAHGEDCSVFPTKDAVTIPYEEGVRGLIWDGWQGSHPSETVRYAANGITPLAGVMHANARRRALGLKNDGYSTQSWLTDGCLEACTALTEMGYWWGVYSGKFGYPSTKPTNAAPHSWASDISDSDYNSYTNWRSMFDPAFAGGMAFVCIDAAGGALSTDCEKLFQDVCETVGTSTGPALQGFSGSFTNDHARRMHVEAVANMDTTSWAHSWVANYDVFEESVGDPSQMQIDQCQYPPIVLCVQCADADDTGSNVGNRAFLYTKAMELLRTYPTIFVAVKYVDMRGDGLDMGALVAASDTAITDPEDGTPGQGSEDADEPFYRPGRLPSLPRSRYQRLTPRIGP